MKYSASWAMAAGLVLTAACAQAQVAAPRDRGPSYMAVSDFGGPYTEAPPPPASRYRYGRDYGYGPRGPGYGAAGPAYGGDGYGPALLPPTEVYAVLRDNGFSPLGIPRQRGYVYIISVIDHGGDDGRLIIDGLNGRIIRFIPAYRMRDDFDGDLTMNYGRTAPLPDHTSGIAVRRPGAVPQVASHIVPLPKASPLASKSAPETPQRSAAVQPRPAAVPSVASIPAAAPGSAEAPPAAPPTAGQAPAAPTILPSQDMPNAQGLE